jgi:type VI secretion system protein ImpL
MMRTLTLLNKQRYKKEIILFGTFLFSSSLIWIIGPHIKLWHHAPLHSVGKRFTAIILLYAAMLAKYFLNRRKKQAVSVGMDRMPVQQIFSAPNNSRLQKVTQLFQQIVTPSDAQIKLNKLPWFLVVGPAGSGKSSLMNNSQISYIPKTRVAQESLDDIANNGGCDWWLTQDAVLLDGPKDYLTSAPDNTWQNLFTRKWRGKNALSGVIVTLPLSDLIEPSTRGRLIGHLKNRITELKEKFGADLPFYFTLTKCDLLPGFLDFFAHSGTDELGQAWGISLPAHTPLVETFSNRFNALIKRLNKQLIWRLHQERGTYERVFIKDFPLQVENLKEILINVLQILTSSGNTFSLQGVYLTSAVQQNAPDMPRERTIETNLSVPALQIMRVPAMPSRSYFIRQFLLQGLSTQYGRTPKIWQRRPVIYGICASTITLTIAFLGYDIFYSKEKMLAMQDTVISTFNIVIPQDKPQETQIGDSITVVS